MQDYIQMSYLGLADSEVKVLESMFSLVPQLKDSYLFNGPERFSNADIILVNADDPGALRTWDKISRVNKMATPLMLTSKAETCDNAQVLQRPIRFRRLINQLENIVRENTLITITDYKQDEEVELRVLVVDDSYAVRKFMEDKLPTLVNTPIFLDVAASGEEAMVKIGQSDFDIIFLDVVMGGVDGYKVCKAIKAKYSAYIVMLTGKKSPFNKVRGTMSGCDSFLTKPPSDELLKNELQKCARLGIKI